MTISDYVGTIFGTSLLQTKSTYNAKLSNKMTNLFTNTRVTVYEYNTKLPNAFTIPGSIELNDKTLKLLEFLGLIPIFGQFVSNMLVILIAYICPTSKLIDIKLNKKIDNNTLIYNKSTGKFTISLDECTVFIGSSLIDLMDNENEIIAILLHEMGHNTQIFESFIVNMGKLTLGGYTFKSIIENALNNDEEDNLEKNNLLKLVIIVISINFILSLISRRQEIRSDEFAIKMGYGDYLHSALSKLYNFIEQNSLLMQLKNTSVNIFDKILHIVNRLSFYIINAINYIHMGIYPSRGQRLEMVKNKTDSYDTSDTNVDRSDHIDKFPL